MSILKKIKSLVPNAITCVNVLCGTLAILISAFSEGDLAGVASWKMGALFIMLAVVADFLDGFAARLLRESHPIGAELDSLSDQVSFGVAPAMLVAFNLPSGSPFWLMFAPAILPVATALRLAKFNIDTRQTSGFLGMPVPANAIFWIGYVATLHAGCGQGVTALGNPAVLIAALLIMSWLMISEVPMLSLKFKTWGFRANSARYLLIIGSAVLFIALQLRGLLWIVVLYVLMSLAFARRSADNHS